ncbi:MAG: hypothetical protein ACRCTZ_23135 [Sarcina sp.]
MALDKNDGTFSPSIEGVVSGKTSQVTGMNGLLNDLIGNDNYLKDKKLDRGNYNGTAEKLHTDSDAIWGEEYKGRIQDSIPKELNKRYIDNINGKAYVCIKNGDSNIISNTTEYFKECTVSKNLMEIEAFKKTEELILFNGAFIIKKTGNIVTMTCDTGTLLAGLGDGGRIFQLPSWAIPKTIVYWGVISTLDTQRPALPIWVKPNGDVIVQGITGTLDSFAYYGTVTYVV